LVVGFKFDFELELPVGELKGDGADVDSVAVFEGRRGYPFSVDERSVG